MVDKVRLTYPGSLLDSIVHNLATRAPLKRLHDGKIGQGVGACNNKVNPIHHMYEVGDGMGLLDVIHQSMASGRLKLPVWRHKVRSNILYSEKLRGEDVNLFPLSHMFPQWQIVFFICQWYLLESEHIDYPEIYRLMIEILLQFVAGMNFAGDRICIMYEDLLEWDVPFHFQTVCRYNQLANWWNELYRMEEGTPINSDLDQSHKKYYYKIFKGRQPEKYIVASRSDCVK